MNFKRILAVSGICIAVVGTLLFAAAYPRPAGRVSDFAGVVGAGDQASMESLLAQLDEKTGVEIAVVTVKSLDGRPVELYANELYREWGIGKKGKDNGALILAAIDDRKVRIEVGYGLEGALTDGTAGEIIRREIVPEFRRGNYGGGLFNGSMAVASIAAHAYGVEAPALTKSASRHRRKKTGGASALFIAFIVLTFVLRHPFIAAMLFGSSMGRRRSRSSYYGGGGFGGGYSDGGGFGGFGGGGSGGGGASGSW